MIKRPSRREKDSLSDVAEVLNLRLDTPVPVILLQKLVLVEEAVKVLVLKCSSCQPHNLPRVESAHVVITLHATVHDSSITLLSDALLCDIDINPIWVTPHAGVNLSKLDCRASVVPDSLHECGVEISIIQKDVWVVEPPVEVSLH